MNPQELQQKIKYNYDQLPYPGLDNEKPLTEMWSLVNVDWIVSLLPFRSDNAYPFKRVLIAGCGTGNEAFEMFNKFPGIEITAVDYSEPAIRIARAYQKKHPEYASIQFEVGDLTADKENWAKAEHYDFISCHGVASYIPNVQAAFDSFAKCLAPNGILYLGVNGATHSGTTIRKSFDYFGYASNYFEDTLKNRQLIELFDRLRLSQEHMANCTAAYLDSDILNAFSLNLPLNKWTEYANAANLHLMSSAELIPSIAKTLSANIFSLLIPKSKKEICEIIALNNVVTFHRLIFCKQAPHLIPWTDFDALIDWEFQTTQLYNLQQPMSQIYGELILACTICECYDVHFRWPVENISVKLLQQKDTSIRIREFLKDQVGSVEKDPNALIQKLFMFYQLGMIHIFPTTLKTHS